MGNIESMNLNTYYPQYDNMARKVTRLRTCVSCLEEKPKTEYKSTTSRCRSEHGPGLCTQCVTMWIQRSVSERGTHITCPQCPLELDYFDIKEVADELTFQRYETLVLSRILAEDSTFQWCAYACGSGQLHPAAVDEPIMTCHNCNKKTCVVHRLPWHSGVTCGQFDKYLALGHQVEKSGQSQRKEITSIRSQRQLLEEQRAQAALESIRQRALDDAASREEVRRTSKSCPKCRFDIEKTVGCDIMTCKHCRHAFCWQCFTPHYRIDRAGNSAHRRDCKHWLKSCVRAAC
ncbi:hypothetical protein F4782DRAFT_199844 [Xylaria castorea]|nr:hypothetical protein F4782DRAFT_199844 [Xylaria castorea]